LIYGELPEKDSDHANKFWSLCLSSHWLEGRFGPGDQERQKCLCFLLDLGALDRERNEGSAAWAAGLWRPVNDKRLEQAYNGNWNKELAMDDVNPVQIANQLSQIVAQLSAIREALEKLVAQSDNAAYSQSKRY
jgi:hypothetical protein